MRRARYAYGIVLAAALCLAAPFALAQSAVATARSYGVMSLVGNTLAIHSERPTVATRIKGSSRDVLPITDPVFDVAVLTAANNAIKAAQPGAAIMLMSTQDAGLYAAQNALFDSVEANADNRAYLIGLLRERAISHLLLVTKHRESAAFKVVNGRVGNGSLEGLGFFIDDTLIFRDKANNDTSEGMLTPFAYVKVRLVDARTLEVLAEQAVLESAVVTKPSSLDAMQAWLAMENEVKVGYMKRLLGRAMAAAIPAVLTR